MAFRRDPVSGTGRFRCSGPCCRSGRPGGVSGNSRVLPHRYLDEGDNGPAHRRLIRRLEGRMWRREVEDQ
jgi:hypothetical protein